jgi:hypothetical protein
LLSLAHGCFFILKSKKPSRGKQQVLEHRAQGINREIGKRSHDDHLCPVLVIQIKPACPAKPFIFKELRRRSHNHGIGMEDVSKFPCSFFCIISVSIDIISINARM